MCLVFRVNACILFLLAGNVGMRVDITFGMLFYKFKSNFTSGKVPEWLSLPHVRQVIMWEKQ